MPQRLLGSFMFFAFLVVSLPAVAQLDSTRGAVDLRAGPDTRFPLVARLPNAANVRVVGCTADPRWCDVQSGRRRGWVYIDNLSQSSRVRNAPTVAFSVAKYWDAHYQTRSWYASRDKWLDWGTPSFVPPTDRLH